MKKIFVLDTSVLLDAPLAYTSLGDNDVVLPLVVISELEGKRHDPILGWQARVSLRGLEDLKENNGGDFQSGVPTTGDPESGTVKIEMNHYDQSSLPEAYRVKTNDMRILAVAAALTTEYEDDDETQVILISKDLPLRLKAEVVGVKAETYKTEVFNKPYRGVETVMVSNEVVNELYDSNEISGLDEVADLPVNTGVILKGSGSQSALTYVNRKGNIKLLPNGMNFAESFGIKPKSVEQKIAMFHLLNEQTKIVSLGGPAGTGKTLLALATGLEQIIERKTYKRIIVFRDLHAVGGQELGYLPGSEAEKMDPWAAAILDTLKAFNEKSTIDYIMAKEMLEVLPLTHIRGRTLNDTFVLIDEAQNLEKTVLLTALSRLGENSKVVLSWDVAQRDNMRVGRYDGIASVVERLKDNDLFAHTTLVKSERSKVAELVTRLMDDMV